MIVVASVGSCRAAAVRQRIGSSAAVLRRQRSGRGAAGRTRKSPKPVLVMIAVAKYSPAAAGSRQKRQSRSTLPQAR